MLKAKVNGIVIEANTATELAQAIEELNKVAQPVKETDVRETVNNAWDAVSSTTKNAADAAWSATKDAGEAVGNASVVSVCTSIGDWFSKTHNSIMAEYDQIQKDKAAQ